MKEMVAFRRSGFQQIFGFLRARPPFRRATLAIFCLASLLPVSAQVIAMQDNFSYTTSALNGHAPTMGSGTWSTAFVNGSGHTGTISTDGTKAILSVNGGGTPNGGSAVGNYAFTPAANTVYTLQATAIFNGPIGSGLNWCWMGCGFTNGTNGGNTATNPAPWMLVAPQALATDNPIIEGFKGSTETGGGSLAAINYANPVTMTVTWNTATGQAQYYVNGTLESSWTTTTSLPTGSYYAYFQAFQTGSAVNLKNITLTAQRIGVASVQDNFTYTTSNINGHAPSNSPAGLGTWGVTQIVGTISTDGTKANISENGGTPGAGGAVASYAFLPSPNMFYTARITFDFNGPIGSYDAWAAFGFSEDARGGNYATSTAPWMLLRPQATATSTPGCVGYKGTTAVASGTIPASYFSGPVTGTITWDTSTGQVKYYIDNYLQSTWTTTTPTAGLCYLFFQGFQTGNDLAVSNITLTAQPLPLPMVVLAPNDPSGGVPVDFPNEFTSPGTGQWLTAQAHTSVFEIGVNYANSTSSTTLQTMITYLYAHNMQLGMDLGCLTYPGDNHCGSGEGYGSLSGALAAANKLKAAGATSLYIQMDEPLEMGVEAPPVGPSWSCGLSMATAASQVAQTIQQFTSVFGTANVYVGDAEPMASIPVSDMQNWMAAFQTAVGKPLQYIDNDMDYRLAADPQLVNMANAITNAGVIFGEFVGGGSYWNPSSNAQWVLTGEENAQIVNATPALAALTHHVTVSSWGSYPTNILPETSNTTLSFLDDFFFGSPFVAEPPPLPFYQLSKSGSGTVQTNDAAEVTAFETAGWTYSGILGGMNATAASAPGTVPIYRYHNSSTGMYAYTINPSEETLFVSQGFAQDRLQGYVFPDSSQGGVPLYCTYNSTWHQYFYMFDQTEYNSLVTAGWSGRGIECYIMPEWLPPN